jgi:hypothetical protein
MGHKGVAKENSGPAQGTEKMNDTIYLGDAVYAHWDGYGIELKLNDHRNECAVYLEPEVLQALTEFYNRCSQPENN